MNRVQIKQEIINNSPNMQKDELLKLLDMCRTALQWQAFTVCHWKQTGKYSYQAVRIWTLRNRSN